MCDAGNAAIFTKKGGYVVPEEVLSRTLEVLDKTKGKSLRMERKGGVYNFNLWIPRPPVDTSSNRFAPLQEVSDGNPGFMWPGADAM